MTLAHGARLGAYQIIEAIGAGGMGQVYKATDTRLERTVAIKVLPPHWADNADMKQRFEREAKTLASLSHPHICVLHDIGRERPSGSDAAIDFLVMEYLEGETLAARIERGALGVGEALKLGLEILDALDKAHRKGVVHRDLKPSNVMITPGGTKLLDFGLAKSGATSGVLSGVSAFPTRTDLTTPGAILGTLQYMAPEQLEGSDADGRTDIFAFGVVLHEMVTGRKAFSGKSHVLLMSAIATSQPEPLSKIDPATPPALEHIVKVCLAKDPADRWQAARDLLAELEWIAEGGASATVVSPLNRSTRARRWLKPVLLAGAAVAALALAVPAYLYFRGAAAEPELRFRVPIQLTADAITAGGRGGGRGANQGFQGVSGPGVFNPENFAVSPNGRAIAFAARPTNTTADPWVLYVRPMGAVTPQRLPGTEDASQPFWSADSRWIGFVAGGKLKRVEASGGPPQEICPVSNFFGGTWNHDGAILFGSIDGLYRVAAEGGKPERVASIEGSEVGHYWPHFLPDGRHYLYTSWSAQPTERTIVAGTIGAKQKTIVLPAASNAGYSDPGYLVFQRESAVYAQSFSADSLKVSGEAVRVADEVPYNSATGRGQFSVSPTGVLAYFFQAGGGLSTAQDSPLADLAEWQLGWISRVGQRLASVGPPGAYRGVEVSPDTTRVAVHRHDATGGDVYVIEPRGSQTNLTQDATRHGSMPIWSPDGKSIVYAALKSGKWGLYRTLSSGAGKEELLYESDLPKAPMSWSKDEARIVFWVQDPKTASDLWVLTVADKKAEPLIATPFNEVHAQISPDGKWLAYASDSKDSRYEIYVKPFPTGNGGWQVSYAGGDWPRWRKDTKELFFHAPVALGAGTPYPFGGPLSVAVINTASGIFEAGPPRDLVVFPALNVPHTGGQYHPYAVSPDGERFLIVQWVPPPSAVTGQIGPDTFSGLTVAMNWTQGLKK
jgi:Tol biopolymer transport system component